MASTEFREVEINLRSGEKLVIVHNLPAEGPNNVSDAINAWVLKTYEFNNESLCHYINAKRYTQLANCIAMTKEQYEVMVTKSALK